MLSVAYHTADVSHKTPRASFSSVSAIAVVQTSISKPLIAAATDFCCARNRVPLYKVDFWNVLRPSLRCGNSRCGSSSVV